MFMFKNWSDNLLDIINQIELFVKYCNRYQYLLCKSSDSCSSRTRTKQFCTFALNAFVRCTEIFTNEEL